MRLSLFALGPLFLFVGCASSITTTPRTRVAADLGCTAAETRVEKIADARSDRDLARWQVTGCGRTGVYVCTTPVRDCWREGEIHAESQR